jgi:FAD/FMN-containing dehydrogenase/Fe-S oxidoreductase
MNAPALRTLPIGAGDSQLAARLKGAIRGEVLFDAGSRGRYATDASIYQVEPVGVVVPRDEADLQAIVDVARQAKVPLLPRGAGTSQCGQTVGAALVVDVARHLREVTGFDRDARTVEVQPGIALDHLNAWLRPHGLWFPVDVSTSAQATLGGMAGNNSCGSRSIRYGNMVHNVAAIDAILADGTQARFGRMSELHGRAQEIAHRLEWLAARERDEIERQYPKVLRRVGGYNLDIFHPQSERPYTTDNAPNLAHLLVGSEGTLALTRRLTLDLAPLPAHRTLGVVNFTSFHRAMDSAQHIVRLKPTAVELVDRTMIELARGNPAFRPVIERALIGAPEAILLVEFAGEDREEQVRDLRRLVELMGDLGQPGSVVEMVDAGAQRELWEVRKAGLNIMMSMRGDGKPVSFIEDCAVPLPHLAEYTRRLTEVFERHGTRGTWYAHASVGTLHVRPILDMRRDGAEKMRAIAEEAGALVREYKGAFSGEHGDGLVRSEWVAWQFGPRLARAFEEVKTLFDPEGLMNPGKIVRASRMDDRSLFRYPPGYTTEKLSPALDWSAWNVQSDPRTEMLSPPGSGGDPAGGFAKAVEMCNNNGHCRKFDAGTMCPSWRVTRDERHLTRGRANTLRLALSGQLGPQALASDELHETLALCVSCKGCKRDCPTGVDMARMKIEVLNQRLHTHGLPMRDRLVANLPAYAPWAARFAGMLNGVAALPGSGWLRKALLGLAPGRSLPMWQSATFLSSPSPTPARSTADREVILFADTFNNYFEPDNLHAAQRVLRAAGYSVAVARPTDGTRPLCCGRTRLAVGDVEGARREARRLLDALLPAVERGVSVVGLEPSCLLGLRDEYLVMGLGPQAEVLAAQALTFEEFLVREKQTGRLALMLAPRDPATVLLHGHCHQKAFDVVRPVQQVLGWVPGLKVETIESSCCGMAGAFGFAAEHYETSIAMGELSLLPAVRNAPANAIVVADGTSCRHQIHDGTGRTALHVARVLDQALTV